VIPGQFLAGEYPGNAYSPERTRQRIAALLQAGFDTFIDLTGPGETVPYEPILRQEAEDDGMQIFYQRFAIADYGLPDRQQMQAILDYIDQAIANGRKIYLHCQGGIGRTGTTVGCYLVRHGLSGQQALEQLAARWLTVPKSAFYPHSPETFEQEEFVRQWPAGGV
jgi:hypothetical protein